ncbi:MAG: hypothetical protein SFV21_02095 [Rhodospirillaceae bacterium]|nr:hypothetical protein [Rhodospirillaceae bacterium]
MGHFVNRALAAAFLVVVGSLTALAQAPAPVKLDPGAETMMQEFVIGVSDLAQARRAYTDVLRWKVKHEGALDQSIAVMWGLAPKTVGRELVVGNAASAYGFVRLVQVDGVERVLARPHASWFDIGGMLNFNVLVKDLDGTMRGLRALGWHQFADPESYVYPTGAKGKSVMMFGDDDVVLSFQERQSPPLQGWPLFEGATHIETGYQIVTDIEAWTAFWTKTVGLTAREIRTRVADKPIGPNDYRLPHNSKGLDDSKQGGAYPRKGGEQLLGVRQFINATGADYSSRARPPNLGIVGVRLPMADVDALYQKVKASGVAMPAPMQVYTLAPYGLVKGFAVAAPGGSGLWTEFFEQGATPLTKAEMESLLSSGAKNKWTGFGGKPCDKCTSAFNKDGSAKVTWSSGEAVGTWTLKGNAICTSWTTLRDGRESCAVYYKVDDKTYASYTVAGQPEGMNYFE